MILPRYTMTLRRIGFLSALAASMACRLALASTPRRAAGRIHAADANGAWLTINSRALPSRIQSTSTSHLFGGQTPQTVSAFVVYVLAAQGIYDHQNLEAGEPRLRKRVGRLTAMR